MTPTREQVEAALRALIAYVSSYPTTFDSNAGWPKHPAAVLALFDAALASRPAPTEAAVDGREVVVARGRVSRRVSGDTAIVVDDDDYGESRGTFYVEHDERLKHGHRVSVIVRDEGVGNG